MAVKPRLVVVGIGSIGRRHARLLAGRGDLQVEWCEPNQQLVASAAAELGAPACVHSEFDAMLATAPAMVLLATPHDLHAVQTIKALEAGAHVLCEKPMAERPSDARRMLAASMACRRVLDIGFQLHFHPGLRRLKELIDSGILGAIGHLHCRVGSYVTLENSRTRYQHSLAGALMLDYAHQADLLYWFLRSVPVGVYAAGSHLKTLDLHSNPNVLSVNFDYARPVLGTIHLNYLQAPERHEYEVVGDRGWAILDLGAASLTVGIREGGRTWRESFEVARDALYQAEHQSFLDAVNAVGSPESPPQEGLVSVLMTSAAIASWQSRQRVSVETP